MVICHFGEISAKLGVGTLWQSEDGEHPESPAS